MANYDNQNQDRNLDRNQQGQAQDRELEQGRGQGYAQDRDLEQGRGQAQDREIGYDRNQDMDRAPDQMMSDKRAQQGQQQNALRDEHSSETSLNRQHGGDLSRQGVERNRNAGGFDGKRDR